MQKASKRIKVLQNERLCSGQKQEKSDRVTIGPLHQTHRIESNESRLRLQKRAKMHPRSAFVVVSCWHLQGLVSGQFHIAARVKK